MKPKIIKDIRNYLIKEEIYTDKDELTLTLLENTYLQYIIALKDVKENGQTISIVDRYGNKRTQTNPNFSAYMDLQKELFKLIESLYLTPKSRKSKKENIVEEDDPFNKMVKNLKEIEKR